MQLVYSTLQISIYKKDPLHVEGGPHLNVQSRNFEHENRVKLQHIFQNCTLFVKFFLTILKKNLKKT